MKCMGRIKVLTHNSDGITVTPFRLPVLLFSFFGILLWPFQSRLPVLFHTKILVKRLQPCWKKNKAAKTMAMCIRGGFSVFSSSLKTFHTVWFWSDLSLYIHARTEESNLRHQEDIITMMTNEKPLCL